MHCAYSTLCVLCLYCAYTMPTLYSREYAVYVQRSCVYSLYLYTHKYRNYTSQTRFPYKNTLSHSSNTHPLQNSHTDGQPLRPFHLLTCPIDAVYTYIPPDTRHITTLQPIPQPSPYHTNPFTPFKTLNPRGPSPSPSPIQHKTKQTLRSASRQTTKKKGRTKGFSPHTHTPDALIGRHASVTGQTQPPS